MWQRGVSPSAFGERYWGCPGSNVNARRETNRRTVIRRRLRWPYVHVLIAAAGAAVCAIRRARRSGRRPVSGASSRRLTHASVVGVVGRNVVAAHARGGPRGRAARFAGRTRGRRGSSKRVRRFAPLPDRCSMASARRSRRDRRRRDGGTLTLAAGAGNHRLFIAEVGDGVMVASQLAPLVVALGARLSSSTDRTKTSSSASGSCRTGARCTRAVRALGAGTVRVVPGADHGHVLPMSEPVDVDVTDRSAVRKALHEAFFSALEAQAGPRRRHAVLLGGFDSALVAAGLRGLGHDVDCYTFGFGDPAYEQRNAELVA